MNGMEEKNIIDMIAEAEEKASGLIAEAQDEATAIVTEAQKKAMEITKSSEENCARRTAEILQKAGEDAESAYESSLIDCKRDAKAYADGILEHVGPQVDGIVGRITK